MGDKLKWLAAKIGLIVLGGSLYFKKGFIFLFKVSRWFLEPLGRLLYAAAFVVYKGYFLAKKFLSRIFLPTRDLVGLSTNKYIIHAAILLIAFTVSIQNVFASTSVMGDYGKKSILFRLARPSEEEEIAGLPINSDIESLAEEGEAAGFEGEVVSEPNTSFGYVGGDYIGAPKFGAGTRVGIEYYIVKKGDTVSSIAEQFGITINTILWANRLTQSSYIRPGDKLTILPVSGVSHTVKKGETLAAIAKKYQADADKILEFNKLADAAALRAGQVLIVPEGKIIYVPPAPKPYVSAPVPERVYASSGQLFWPVPSRRITQYFTWRHPAIDIGLSTGGTVAAAEAGTVIYAGWGRGYGLQVLIDHGNGMKTRYAHNSRLIVAAGDRVGRGDTVAMSGNTGWSTGPHLHFEVYVGNVRRNPLLYVK